MAIEFVAASSQKIQAASHADFDLVGVFTINYWIKHIGSGNVQNIHSWQDLSPNHGYIMNITTDNVLSFVMWDSSGLLVTNISSGLSTNVWHMVSVTRNAANRVDLWIDGSSVDSDATSLGNVSPAATFFIGRNWDDSTRHLNAQLMEVAKWNADLTSRLPQLYSGGPYPVNRMPLAIDPANLKYYLMMNERPEGVAYTGASVFDSSGNNHTFTATNSPLGKAAPISVLGAGQLIVQAPAVVTTFGRRGIRTGGELVGAGIMTGGRM